MTSMTSPSDTIRLRSRLSIADPGFSGPTTAGRGPTDTAELDRTLFPGNDAGHVVGDVIVEDIGDDLDLADHLALIDDAGTLDEALLYAELDLDTDHDGTGLQVIERPGGGTGRLDPAAITAPSTWTRATVRAFDITVATVALVVLAPLMALVAIAVMVDSPGPIVYGSTRVGHNRPTFRAWKFRSMHTDAETDLDTILAHDAAARKEYETYHKLHNDPRLTRVGAVIRQTSLDELPQLINILLGQMSVVGPRPKLPKDAAAYGDTLDAVLTVRPGLTGLWQVSGRNLLPMSDRVVLDLEYVATRSLIGDTVICARTFLQLWRPGKHGAC
jgi:lipopolysaccharide/colanic/teichoic acid biosynthesis glycosyltransferase